MTTQAPKPTCKPSFLHWFVIAGTFILAILFSHLDTKSQIQDVSVGIQVEMKGYVQKQQEVLYTRVQQDVGIAIEGIRQEQEKTNMLLGRIYEIQSGAISTSANGNTSTSTSSVVNTPSTTLLTH